ncbi:MAG: helix-turn-helix domain-containing protein [Thermodesulfobacteriota bacterium]
MEPQDIEAIAEKVSEKVLKPLLSRIEGRGEKDVIFDVKGAAEYLHVAASWIYKQASLKTIPFSKVGKYLKFRKKDLDKLIDDGMVKPVPTLRAVKCANKIRRKKGGEKAWKKESISVEASTG